MVTSPDRASPITSVLDFLEQAVQEYEADITHRGEDFFEFKVPVVARLVRDLAVRWRFGSTSWPLSFVGSGSFSATQVRDRVVVSAELRISQYLVTRGAMVGVLSGAISAFNGAIAGLVFGASAGLAMSAVCYALARWEFGFWFQRLDRLLREGRPSRRLTDA
jgi:hypothetical protein